MTELLEVIGLTQEELRERVVARIVTDLLTVEATDSEDGRAYSYTDDSAFAAELQHLVKQRIDDTVASLAEQRVLPDVGTLIENFTLQATNAWGEKTGEKITFTEYLVKRADAWVSERVDSSGKSKEESRDSYWKGSQTRIAHMIHEHLQYHIAQAINGALRNVTSSIAKSLEETVKIKLAEAVAGLQVKTDIRT